MAAFNTFSAPELRAAILDLQGKDTARARRHIVRALNALEKFQGPIDPQVVQDFWLKIGVRAAAPAPMDRATAKARLTVLRK